jgi:hypothetical protein
MYPFYGVVWVRERTDPAGSFDHDRGSQIHAFERHMMNTFSSYAIACAAVLVSACASPGPAPTEQMAVSKVAIANAVSAGGAEYASVEMQSAQNKMDGATRAMEKQDYDVARRLAEEAQVDARLAEKKAHSAKAQKAAMVMQDDIRVLRDEINRQGK